MKKLNESIEKTNLAAACGKINVAEIVVLNELVKQVGTAIAQGNYLVAQASRQERRFSLI